MVARVAVTGAAGRVGRGVLELLSARGTTVVAIDSVAPGSQDPNDGVTWAQIDITDYAALVEALDGCDGLVHLAAIPSPRRSRTSWSTPIMSLVVTTPFAPPQRWASRKSAKPRVSMRSAARTAVPPAMTISPLTRLTPVMPRNCVQLVEVDL